MHGRGTEPTRSIPSSRRRTGSPAIRQRLALPAANARRTRASSARCTSGGRSCKVNRHWEPAVRIRHPRPPERDAGVVDSGVTTPKGYRGKRAIRSTGGPAVGCGGSTPRQLILRLFAVLNPCAGSDLPSVRRRALRSGRGRARGAILRSPRYRSGRLPGPGADVRSRNCAFRVPATPAGRDGSRSGDQSGDGVDRGRKPGPSGACCRATTLASTTQS